MPLASILRSPWLRYVSRCGMLALGVAGIFGAGVAWERRGLAVAVAEARAESATRAAALAVQAERARAATRDAEAATVPLAASLAQATRERDAATQARERAERRLRRVAIVEAVPGSPAPPAEPLEPSACAELLPLVEEERDAALRQADAAVAALDAERRVSSTLRDAIAATNREMAGLRLELQDSRAGEIRVAARSKRRGTVIAIGFAAGLVGGAVLSR